MEWLREAGASQATLARVAGVYAAHPFVLTCVVADGVLPRIEQIEMVWRNRCHADVLIAARPQRGLVSRLAGLQRRLLRRVLSLPVRDVFSPCRLYRRDVLTALRSRLPQGGGAMADLELLLHIVAEGYQVREVGIAEPLPIRAASDGSVWLRPGRLAALWRTRNSILSADYDDRAYDSIIPLQRYWQRQRFRLVTELIAGEGAVLDVGCGSSRILSALPAGSVGIDILFRKLRYARRFPTPLIHASGFHLPVADGAFPCVLCSQVIEHVPKTSPILQELCRVLKPGGRLVIGTPDYAHWEWRFTERLYAACAPGGYADEHIAHYSRQELLDFFQSRGFVHEATRYILRGELIMAFRKPSVWTA
ncbi:MAG: methyltransferase domain-containing protein [Anaerolineae bacterium]|nr:methyltransferase domain-containing protein [Thermoflexales bacterium]MDW8408950.1 methyltransferase domain-containing protein [Anaerolineae bacterium]